MDYSIDIASDSTLQRVANAMETLARIGEVVDNSDLPGGKILLSGTKYNGFLGFVQASEFFTGAQIASMVGLSKGTLINTDTPWIKYIRHGKICYTPVRPIRHSVDWDSIYNAGGVYGTGDEGFLPPRGRLGENLFIDSDDNSINCSNQNFLGNMTSDMDYADSVGAVGDKLILRGWATANNGEVEIVSITNTKIIVTGKTLVDEMGGDKKVVYNKGSIIKQDTTIEIAGLTGIVRLMEGANVDPIEHLKPDRSGPGPNNEYNWIIGQLHLQAKLKNWAYPQYMDDALGDFGVYLTDKDMVLHHIYGYGSYRWQKNVSNTTSWRRVGRGYFGVSYLHASHSWHATTNSAWAPVVEFPQTVSH